MALVDSLPEQFAVSIEQLTYVLANFSGLAHRCAWIAEKNGIQYFNDSKGTNVGSTLAAIEGLASTEKQNIVLIAGGVGKDQDFEPLADACKLSVKQAVLFGRDANVMAKDIGSSADVCITETLAQALLAAEASAQAGDVILFSPACASFDQFKNYVERGEVFEKLVSNALLAGADI